MLTLAFLAAWRVESRHQRGNHVRIAGLNREHNRQARTSKRSEAKLQASKREWSHIARQQLHVPVERDVPCRYKRGSRINTGNASKIGTTRARSNSKCRFKIEGINCRKSQIIDRNPFLRSTSCCSIYMNILLLLRRKDLTESCIWITCAVAAR